MLYTNQSKPLVSVCIVTFQHVNYIRDCLDGVLMQKTNFDFEILLGEDSSTDGTKEICEEYAHKYPEKIKLFLHKRESNIIINGNPTGRFNFINNLQNAQGKYIALCEGDDYWADPFKIQKQVDFLEINPDYHLCCTDYDERNNLYIISNSKLKNQFGLNQDQDITFKDYFNNRLIMRTLTVVFKSEILNSFFNEIPSDIWLYGTVGDIPIWFYILLNHKVRFLATNSSVYRINTGTVSRPTKIQNKYHFRKGVVLIRNYFAQLYGDKKLIKSAKLEFLKNEMFNCYITKNKLLVLKTFFKMILLRPLEIKRIYILISILFNKNTDKLKQYLNLNSL